MARTPAESARVEFRLPPELKREIEEAATLVGATFTSFATEVLVERARQIKREYNLTILSGQEQEAFLALLSSPPEPSDALKKTMQTRVAL